METKSFIKILRKIIREEVSSAIKSTLNETKKPSHKQVIEHGMNLDSINKNAKRTKKKFTKDSMLNDLLNETATQGDFRSMSQGPIVSQTESYPTMGNMYNSSLAEGFGMQSNSMPLVTNDVNGAPVNMANENVAKTVDLMTKDYSQLMKAIDKKKGVK